MDLLVTCIKVAAVLSYIPHIYNAYGSFIEATVDCIIKINKRDG